MTGHVSAKSESPTSGVWFVYNVNWNAEPINVFSDELEARRWADEHGYGSVVFWPFGVEWDQVER